MKPLRPVDCVAQVLSSRALTSDVNELKLEVQSPADFRFRAGQFVNLSIPVEGERAQIRAYSIASSPSTPGILTFYYDNEVPGPGVSYLRSRVPGDRIQFKGPLGLFVLKEPLDVPVIIVSHISAVGMALQLADSALEATPGRPVTFVCEPKQAGELWFGRDLLDRAIRHPAFRHVITCPDAPAGWQGPTRSLLEEALRRIDDPARVQVYVCGLGNMVGQLKAALKAMGVPTQAIVSEKWSKSEEEEA